MTHPPLSAILGLVVLLIGFVFSVRGELPSRPNIVLILADDLGWSDLGCYGADLHETPHLDRLARDGVRFTQAYAMSVCSPTRSAIMTGQHAARLHMTVWRESSVRREEEAARSKRKLLPPVTAWNVARGETTLAEVLKAAGYLTFHVGKWHLGDADHAPETQGFDVNIGGTHWGAPQTYFWPFRGEGRFGAEFRYVPGLGVGRPGDYLTDRFADEAIRLIDAAQGRPFFLNLWFHSPHTPIEGKPNHVARFQSKISPGMRHLNPDYAAMVYSLDENVGRILNHLNERGLANNTLVVFTSDNGGYIGMHNRAGKAVPVTSNSPLRSGKGSLYEGGIRVPLIVRWPGVSTGGNQCDEPVVLMDLFHTLGAASRSPATVAGDGSAAQKRTADGLDIAPLLSNPSTSLGRSELFFHYPHYYATTTPVSAIRSGSWKLLEYFEDRHVELYDLADDPGEQSDVATKFPDRVAELRGRLDSWRVGIGAQLPVQNPAAGAAAKGRP